MIVQAIIADHIWHAQHDVNFGPLRLKTRATFVRLSTGVVWVHSPVPPTEFMIDELNEIGDVRFVIAPNKTHHLFFRQFLDAFPSARGFIAPGLAQKRPDLEVYAILDEAARANWAQDFESVFVDGLPVLNETVWFHHRGGTLILTDLLFSFAPRPFGLSRLIAQLLGVYNCVGMSRTMKSMVRDKAAFARSVAQIQEWHVKRIILAHDLIIEEDAATKLREAFEWLS